MGKLDDVRRQREQQFLELERLRAKGAPNGAVAPAAAPPPAPRAPARSASSRAAPSEDEQGKCPGCGKTKPLKNGLLAQHQKGFGKACAGSRKAPV